MNDALSDVLLAEVVHQAVLGNHDRVAASLDSSSGAVPPEPAVVQTPRSGRALTHRVALQLELGLDPLASPVPGIAATPRAIAQPALNAWLAARLPPPADVACRVRVGDPAGGAPVEVLVTQEELGLQPLDLLAVLHDRARASDDELDDRVLRHVLGVGHAARRCRAPDPPTRSARPASRGARSSRSRRSSPRCASLVLRSRRLGASDMTPPGTAGTSRDDAGVDG